MDEPAADTLATRAGRTTAVAQLRSLADRLEALPLDAVAEVLVLLEPALDDLRRQAAFALERARRRRLSGNGVGMETPVDRTGRGRHDSH